MREFGCWVEFESESEEECVECSEEKREERSETSEGFIAVAKEVFDSQGFKSYVG